MTNQSTQSRVESLTKPINDYHEAIQEFVENPVNTKAVREHVRKDDGTLVTKITCGTITIAMTLETPTKQLEEGDTLKWIFTASDNDGNVSTDAFSIKTGRNGWPFWNRLNHAKKTTNRICRRLRRKVESETVVSRELGADFLKVNYLSNELINVGLFAMFFGDRTMYNRSL